MKIGELASQAGCGVETVRYYERVGLLPPPARTAQNNYRHYQAQHLLQLLFIRRCRTLDLTQEEIRQLLAARQQPDAGCEAINQLVDAHLAQVRARLAELQALEQQLLALRGQCHASLTTRECGILKELEQGATP